MVLQAAEKGRVHLDETARCAVDPLCTTRQPCTCPASAGQFELISKWGVRYRAIRIGLETNGNAQRQTYRAG